MLSKENGFQVNITQWPDDDVLKIPLHSSHIIENRKRIAICITGQTGRLQPWHLIQSVINNPANSVLKFYLFFVLTSTLEHGNDKIFLYLLLQHSEIYLPVLRKN
jgi:hypothetical protein